MPVAAAGGALALADDLVLSRMGYGPTQLAGIRGLGLDAAQDRGITETAVPAETSAGTAGMRRGSMPSA